MTSPHQQRTAQRRLCEARFPEPKTLDQIDWQALKGVSRARMLELASCEYLDRAEDVVLAGPIGTGKTHLAIALGVEAARRHGRAGLLESLRSGVELLEARDERQLGRLSRRLGRVNLLILDLC